MVTLSIQADEELQAALQERADLQGKTVSDLAREILREAIAQRPLGERVPTFRGQGLRPGVNLDDSAALLDLVESRPHSLLELEGLGAELWLGMDAQEYVDDFRREWDHRP